ncbi:MAG: 16S rRNA (uracil(1498)-N(3))-methyltransferase, partial [Alistipes sp.]|nr:16S rRNA (uracil(1498)-N(3))-methyltransferase [Alistipes sp.]
EGDFSPEEVRLAVENGFEEITLGTQRLRTETAAVMAVAMVAVVNTL